VTIPVVEARPAATALLVRDTDQGCEVLMVRRPPVGFFGGLTVFPGGAVDPEDESDLAAEAVIGEHPDRRWRVAALRELAEETGLALTEAGVLAAPPARGAGLFRALVDAGLRLDGASLTLVSRWVTPELAPKRFDTRFYIARAENAPEVRLDADELVDHMWITASRALHGHAQGELDMFLPTVAHLRWLDRRSDVADAIASASGADGRSMILPRVMEDGSIVPIHMPGEPG
jgi:8-oxo-dGTP pyrophosphatase MutT (NUDIX family)